MKCLYLQRVYKPYKEITDEKDLNQNSRLIQKKSQGTKWLMLNVLCVLLIGLFSGGW